jgi:hypothetical protein
MKPHGGDADTQLVPFKSILTFWFYITNILF